VKKRKIKEKIEKLEERLENAEAYLTRGVNVEGRAYLHMDDYRGKSGHPSWILSQMVPRVARRLARKQRALETIESKEREKKFTQRKKRAKGQK
jgi:hypothetical protein